MLAVAAFLVGVDTALPELTGLPVLRRLLRRWLTAFGVQPRSSQYMEQRAKVVDLPSPISLARNSSRALLFLMSWNAKIPFRIWKGSQCTIRRDKLRMRYSRSDPCLSPN
jgi:hypothetical protein